MIKSPPAMQETWVQYLVGKIPWRREWLPTAVFLPGEFHGQRSLEGYSPWDLQIVWARLSRCGTLSFDIIVNLLYVKSSTHISLS